jgi:hypothetical protein
VERMNEDGQWIILMAFIVSIGIFFLALVINQSTIIGQTTAEGVLEFPKNDFQDLRDEVFNMTTLNPSPVSDMSEDIRALSLLRKNAVVDYKWYYQPISGKTYTYVEIHYNNGVTSINETAYL